MTKLKRALALLAILTLSLSLPACKNPNNPDEEDDLPTSEELAIEIDPRFMEFRHVIGQSPCPQLIGRLTIRNRGTSPFTTDIRARSASAPLTFGPDQTVQPGTSVTIDVFFNCNSQSSFLTTVDTLRENQSQQNSDTLPPGSFNVSGIITR